MAGVGWYDGTLRNSGMLVANGGDVDASCVAGTDSICQGGTGGEIDVMLWNGALMSNAPIQTHGGSAPNGAGGAGGVIAVFLNGDDSAIFTTSFDIVPPRDISLSGNLDSSGGLGASGGGSAGKITISLDPAQLPNGQEVILYGYARLDTSGGAGLANGGNAGPITLINQFYAINDHCQNCPVTALGDGPGGSVVNYANLVARGGNGLIVPKPALVRSGVHPDISTDYIGGSGGAVLLATQSTEPFGGDTFEKVINAGSIDTRGGDSDYGASAGSVSAYGMHGISNSGTIQAVGGQAYTWTAGNGAAVSFTSEVGGISNAGDIDCSGGAGCLTGGAGSLIAFSSMSTSDSGHLIAAGGATTGGESSTGGNGGLVTLVSSTGTTSVTAPAPAGISVAGGAAPGGNADGAGGTVTIDEWDVTTSWTH